jgi:hypothetical protein
MQKVDHPTHDLKNNLAANSSRLKYANRKSYSIEVSVYL